MGRKYNTNTGSQDLLYDDNAFSFFFLALLTVVWVPAALSRIFRLVFGRYRKETALEKAKKGWCACSFCQQKKLVFERNQRPALYLPFSDILFIVTGIVLVVVAYRVHISSGKEEAPFDPFEILGVPTTSTKRQIQKAYRRLSIKHHPDKNIGDPTAGDRFIKISKAFAALTDEVAKQNFIKYGNPDGYAGTTMGLGLPEWVAKRHNTVLLLYCFFIVIFFPVAVGVWWQRRNKQMTDIVQTDTYILYRDTLQQSQKYRDMLAAFACSFEFEELYNPDLADAVADLVHALKRANKLDVRKINFVMEPTPAQVQNVVILAARISRIPIPRILLPTLNKMLERAEPLLTALTDTVGMFQRPDCEAAWGNMNPRGHTVRLIYCLRLMQCIFQGTDEKDPALLQLPHFTDREVKFCTTSRTIPARHIYDFMRLKTVEQQTLLRGFTDDEFEDVQRFCERYPLATLSVSDPVVEDEEDGTVCEGDTVTIRAKLTVMRREGSVFSPHAPDLPVGKSEVWWVWLADQRLLCPLDVKRLVPTDARGHDPEGRKKDDERTEKDASDELAKDLRVTVYDLKFNLMAPRAGSYVMEIQAAVDCYHGCSKKHVFTMDVKAPVEPPPLDSVRYFDTDDEPSSSSSDESHEDEDGDEKEEEEGEDSDTSEEYEYIEVTDDEGSGEAEDDDIIDDGVSNLTAEELKKKKNS